ncbi:hypothetical protein [Hydrogenophaga sp. NFH-34]|uniref:hypothetical protein n=1 Tax=Hydrogenophaga sp. NFH-34 TaxID=2744446 RepID=UPI001F3592C7|nr:hypothetical protein [Hydrogenophaga sp. NFH-34]
MGHQNMRATKSKDHGDWSNLFAVSFAFVILCAIISAIVLQMRSANDELLIQPETITAENSCVKEVLRENLMPFDGPLKYGDLREAHRTCNIGKSPEIVKRLRTEQIDALASGKAR